MRSRPMDFELASAVLKQWDSGQPVSEVSLFKAASAVGIDPMEALIEARFLTYFDNYLSEKRAMSLAERSVFSAGAGFSSLELEKTASSHQVPFDNLIVEALRENNFVPHLEKIANLPIPGAEGPLPEEGQPPAGQEIAQQAGEAMVAPPQPGAVVQQQPQQRMFKPSPTGPEQLFASPQGNMEELLQTQQGAFQDPEMAGNGGQPPAAGMPEPAPPPPSPEERIQQVGPNLDPETISRYAEQLARFEEGIQMQVSDPKQMVKFVKELQKVDGKRIDQGIKAMGQQLEQEQASELGVDGTPTIDGPGAGGQGQQVMSPKPGQENSPPPQMGEENSGLVPSKPPQQKPIGQPQENPKAVLQSAAEKVAHVARYLARSSFNR